jgi:hypothetical protein
MSLAGLRGYSRLGSRADAKTVTRTVWANRVVNGPEAS